MKLRIILIETNPEPWHVRQQGFERSSMVRDISEPDLRTNSEFSDVSMGFLWSNGRSLENILENDEVSHLRARSEQAEALILGDPRSNPLSATYARTGNRINRGAIPKQFEVKSRVTVNPISESVKRIPTSRTYFCLKSILKHNRR